MGRVMRLKPSYPAAPHHAGIWRIRISLYALASGGHGAGGAAGGAHCAALASGGYVAGGAHCARALVLLINMLKRWHWFSKVLL